MNRLWSWLISLGLAGMLLTLGALIFIPQILYPPLTSADLRDVPNGETRIQLRQAQADLQNKARTSILQTLAGLLVVVGGVAAWRQANTSREGQITERFSRAIDQIGSDNVEIRVGGIYALRRLALNSREDRHAVQSVLAVFVRNRVPWAVGLPGGPRHPTPAIEDLPWLHVRAPDVHAAVGALSRRPRSDVIRPIYLSRVDLRNIQLDDASLADCQIRHTNMARSWLRRTRFDRSQLKDTDLRRAYLVEASFVDANLAGAYLEGADVQRADFRGANLRGTDMRVDNLRKALLTNAQADANTIWPSDFSQADRDRHGVLEDPPTNP